MNADPLVPLIQNAEFLRRLARSLVADENVADDVVQQTWLAALTRPPRTAGSPREWLATVARNFVRSLERSASRRRRREEGAARPERSGRPQAEVLARDELVRCVFEAVLGLDEPYRETVLLRFYEGVSPREIARRQGIPLETVRTRLRRALSILRAELDRKTGGLRSSWMPALVLVTGLRPPSHLPILKAVKEWMVRHPIEIVVTATAASLLGTLVLLPGLLSAGSVAEEVSSSSSVESVGPPRVANPGAVPAAARPTVEVTPGPREIAAMTRPGLSSSGPSPRADGASSTITVRGRLLDHERHPVSGVRVVSYLRRQDVGREEIRSVSGGDGRFEVPWDPPLPELAWMHIEAQHAGFEQVRKPLVLVNEAP